MFRVFSADVVVSIVTLLLLFRAVQVTKKRRKRGCVRVCVYQRRPFVFLAVDMASAGRVDLPAEMIWHIARFLDRLSDVAACLCASRLFDRSLLLAASMRAFGDDPRRAVEWGAPPDVVECLFARHDIAESLLLPAVRGGNVATVDWLCASMACPANANQLSQIQGDTQTSRSGSGCRPHRATLTLINANTGAVVWTATRRRDTNGHAHTGVDALFRAIEDGHAAITERLFDAHAAIPSLVPLPVGLGVECMSRAAQWGHIEIMDNVHARIVDGRLPRSPHAPATACGCVPLVGKTAFESDQGDALDWLARHNCSGAYAVARYSMAEAIARGLDSVARWLLRTNAREMWSTVDNASMIQAAANGCVGTIALAHENGLAECDHSVLFEAASQGHLGVLRWAAGEAVPGVADRRVGARPVGAWHGGWAAWGAAKFGRLGVIRWLLERPDAARMITPHVAALALSRGHVNVALAIHRAGLAPFDAWKALDAAVDSLNLNAVIAVVGHGGFYTRSALALAVKKDALSIVEYLCDRFGTADAQYAIDKAAGLMAHRRCVDYLTTRVEGLCTRVAHGMALAADRSAWYNTPRCRCSACSMG